MISWRALPAALFGIVAVSCGLGMLLWLGTPSGLSIVMVAVATLKIEEMPDDSSVISITASTCKIDLIAGGHFFKCGGVGNGT